jgi:hypothetical protein
MSYLIYNPAVNRYPIRGFNNPNAIKSPDAISFGFRYWRIIFTGYLTEIQFDIDGTPLRIHSSNGIGSTTMGAALVDGIVPTTNGGLILGSTFYFQGVEALPIQDFWISPQGIVSNNVIYNPCLTFRASHSDDNSTWSDVGFGTIQVSATGTPSTLYSPYTGSILRPGQLVKVGYS